MLYTLNFHSGICRLFLNKTGETKKSREKAFRQVVRSKRSLSHHLGRREAAGLGHGTEQRQGLGEKAADNSSGLFWGLELTQLNCSIDRQRETLEGEDAESQKRTELPVLLSAVFTLHFPCKRAP